MLPGSTGAVRDGVDLSQKKREMELIHLIHTVPSLPLGVTLVAAPIPVKKKKNPLLVSKARFQNEKRTL